MIKENIPISMTESLKYIGDKKEADVELRAFIKKFVKLTPKKASELGKKLESLNMMKLKPSYIAKIIDLMPSDKESLNKIFTEISLDEDETKQILDIIGEFE